MVKGNEGIVSITALGLLVATLIWVVLAPSRPMLPFYGISTPRSHAGGALQSCRPQMLTRIRNAVLAASERERCAKIADDHSLQVDDLIQQTRSADAAQAQAELAYQTGLISDFQTVGGFLTLLAAAAAAYYARIAAAETKREADAAERAIATNTRLSEAQVRCYLSFAEARLQLNGRFPVFQVRVKNSGQSPARKIRICYGFSLAVDGNIDIESLETMHEYDVVEDIPAQEAVWLVAWRASLPVSTQEYIRDYTQLPEIIFKVAIVGEDVFEQPAAVTQCFRHNADRLADGDFHTLEFLRPGTLG